MNEQSLPSQPCGSRGRATGFCYEGLGLVCADGSLDREHGCSYSDMRLPSDIVQNGSGWHYVLDRASGLSAPIADPQLNFGSHYFLFSYSLGRSGTSWAMADLDTGEISREPDRVFGYSEGHSEPVGVPDRMGKFHSCRYEFRLISEPYSDVITAERRLAGEAGDDGLSADGVCMGNECWSRRYALRDGKFVPENPDDGGFIFGCAGRGRY